MVTLATVVRRAHPTVWVAAAVWVLLTALVVLLANGHLPFDRPALAALPFAQQVAFPTFGLIEVFALMALVWWLTRRRSVPDMAARAPQRAQAARETAMVWGYAALAQAGGWVLGPALGYRPFSFHIAGTLVGCSQLASPGEVAVWAGYNFVAFAALPYLWFRRRYSGEQLNLRSSDRRGDLTVILAVMAVEGAVELATFPGLLQMSPRQLAIAAPLSFLVFFVGTVLPTMVLIYAILLPRYLKLTGSFAFTVILGGLSYAAMHIVEGWSVFSSPTDTALSLIFVVLTYFGPGMFKAYVTLRTGNAWVHAIGYHAVAPHVIADAPMIAKVFAIR